ncbi:MAG: hypothetical protein ACR2NI_00840 [Pirellulales bacterium]
MNNQYLLGVDFSSAPTRRKPITVAVGLMPTTTDPVYRLQTIREIETLEAFECMLTEPLRWIGGFDLPFGQPRTLIEHERWPTQWNDFVHFFCGQSREYLRETFRDWCNAHPPGNKFAWRKTDRPAGSSPAMRWTNPPVAWMMHAGIGRMLEAGLAFPAHRYPRKRSHIKRIALEAYPGFTARKIIRGSYKSDSPAKQTHERKDRRKLILDAISTGEAGLSICLEANRRWRQRIIADARGDLLDAVICSLQAGHAALQRNFGLPRNLDTLEGWIASVPVR